MAPIEAKILHREVNQKGQVQALTGQVGNVVIHARGIGEQHDNSSIPVLGFPKRWASGLGSDITQEENRDFTARQVAHAVAEASEARGFGGKINMVRLASTSAPFGTEAIVRQILKKEYDIDVDHTIRDSTACSGAIIAATKEIEKRTVRDRHIVVAACEHVSPFSQEDPLLNALFGDAVGAIAFKVGVSSSDLSVIAKHTLFEQDDWRDPVLTLPHTKIGTLPPQEGRAPLKGSKGSCEIRGSRGHVFEFQGGIWQPVQETEEATMNGKLLLEKFGTITPAVMDLTMEEYLRKQGHLGSTELNSIGLIHQPSRPLFAAITNHIEKSGLPLQKHLQGKTERNSRPGSVVRGRVQHVWTPTLETTTLDHNNVSGVTTIFSLLAMIQAGLITQGHIFATAMGVGNNVISAVIDVNEPETTRTVHRVRLPHL